MGRLSLRAPFLKNCQGMQVKLRLVADHIDNHVYHLFFLVWDLIEAKCWQMKFVIDLKDIFEGW